MGLSKPSNLLKVFIADDSPIVRQRLATMLSDLEGIQVVGQAQNPDEASEYIRRLAPDVVIMEVIMSRENRIDLLHSIKRDGLADTVIVCTNYPYEQYRKKCLDAGADFFLDKCLDSRRLIDVLHQLALDSIEDSTASRGALCR
jgi:DNA-binding NarL/FixJ family response regulator